MDRVSERDARPAGSGRAARVARLFLFGALAAFIAAALAGLALTRSAGKAAAQECPEGTLPFHIQFGVPTGSFDPGDLPIELPPEITITLFPGEQFDLIVVVACIEPGETPPEGILVPGSIVAFMTPTPGAPVRFQTPTNTPPPTATVPPVGPTAAATVALPATGIRPPSTGDGGLAEPQNSFSPALVALLALGGGLAIGTASARLALSSESGRTVRGPESGRREG